MKVFEFIGEISTPTGSIFLRFKEKMGNVPPNASKEEKRKAIYLTAYAGFANAPEDLKQAGALRNFNNLKSASDLVDMIKAIMSDKTFLSAKSISIYDDLTDPMKGDSSPPFKRHPYLLKFFKWVEREGGDRLKLVDKVGKEGPPKMKRPRKENPMHGKDIRDIDPADPKYTITFTVDDRFYKTIERSLPNLMKYRGPGRTFLMPQELFNQFRNMVKEKFPTAEIKIVKKAHTSESTLEDDITDEGGPASRTLCLSKRSDKSLGSSQLASCRSQGLRARKGGKSHKVGSKRIKVGGKKIKGKAHGGPLPDWS